LLVAILSTTAEAQATALKFDEFISEETPQYLFDDHVTFRQRVDRLIRRLKLEPVGTKVYFIHYRARVSKPDSYSTSEWQARRAGWEITSRTKIRPDDIVTITGGFRKLDTLEIFIGRKNSIPPPSAPEYGESDAVICPNIWLYAQEFHLDDTKEAVFAAELYPKAESSFSWRVSAGTIIEGQGTKSIKVDVHGIRSLRVGVLADGVSNECPRATFDVFDIGKRPLLLDEFGGLPTSDLRARLDAFFQAVSENPTFAGYMILYGKRKAPSSIDSSIRLVSNHIRFRNFPNHRVKIVKGGYREDGGMELWLLPPGVAPPPARPTVNGKFVPRRGLMK
jgi:hypothetical protein